MPKSGKTYVDVDLELGGFFSRLGPDGQHTKIIQTITAIGREKAAEEIFSRAGILQYQPVISKKILDRIAQLGLI